MQIIFNYRSVRRLIQSRVSASYLMTALSARARPDVTRLINRIRNLRISHRHTSAPYSGTERRRGQIHPGTYRPLVASHVTHALGSELTTGVFI